MRIVLRADVNGIGKRGDIVEVADGFARNHLVPRGEAMLASPGVEAQANAMRRSRDVRDARERSAAEVLARTLVPAVITIPAKTSGSSGKLFGSITTADVAAAVEQQTGIALERRQMHLDEPIRALGTHGVSVKLHNDVQFQVTVEVVKH